MTQIVVIGDDQLELSVLPALGARLHSLRFAGHELLLTPSDPNRHADDPFFWGAFVMAPWCNRVAPGPLVVGESEVNLAPNFRDGSAIHGQVYDAALDSRRVLDPLPSNAAATAGHGAIASRWT